MVYDSGFSVGTKLSAIIRDGAWFWPYARSESIVDIQCKLTEVTIGDEDLPIWNSRNGIYSCADTWELLRERGSLEWFGGSLSGSLCPSLNTLLFFGWCSVKPLLQRREDVWLGLYRASKLLALPWLYREP